MTTNTLTIALYHGHGDARRTVETVELPRTPEGYDAAREICARRCENGYRYGLQNLDDTGATDWVQVEADRLRIFPKELP